MIDSVWVTTNMAANAETTVSQRGGFDWMCMRHTRGKKHPLGERMYLIRRDGDALLYCEECARKVSECDLSKYEAKDFEVLRNQMGDLDCLYYKCQDKNPRCNKRATIKVTDVLGEPPSFFCDEHEPRDTDETNKRRETEGFQRPADEVYVDLLSSDGSVTKTADRHWLINSKCLESFKPDFKALSTPKVEDEKNSLAILFKMALDKEIQHFKGTFKTNAMFTNAFRFRALLDALFKLNALINHPQECDMLEDTTTSGGGAPITMDENKDKKFTVGKGRHVSITVTENPEDCEPFLFARGFNVIITGIEKDKVEYRLEVNFDLEMTEQTRWAASAGLHREAFMIGYIDRTTKRCFCTEGFAIATPDNV